MKSSCGCKHLAMLEICIWWCWVSSPYLKQRTLVINQTGPKSKKKSTLIQIYKHQDPQLWINGKKTWLNQLVGFGKNATSGKSAWCGTWWWCHGLARKLTVGSLWGNGLPNRPPHGLTWDHTASNTTWGEKQAEREDAKLQRYGKITAQPAMWKSPGWEW